MYHWREKWKGRNRFCWYYCNKTFNRVIIYRMHNIPQSDIFMIHRMLQLCYLLSGMQILRLFYFGFTDYFYAVFANTSQATDRKDLIIYYEKYESWIICWVGMHYAHILQFRYINYNYQYITESQKPARMAHILCCLGLQLSKNMGWCSI